MAEKNPPEDPHVTRALAEPRRLDALRLTGLLEAPPEDSFERLVELATKLLDVPTAVVTLVEPARQFFLAAYGVGEPWAEQRGTPISHSFCKHVVADNDELIVVDSRTNEKVKDNPAVDDLDVIAYAGTPLRLSSGEVLGSFCAIDTEPREWSPTQLEALRTLAKATMAEIELRIASRALLEREARFRGALEQIRAFSVTLDAEGKITFINDFFLDCTGWNREELMGRDWFTFAPGDPQASDAFRCAIATGNVPPRNDGMVLTRSGETLVVSWDNIPLRDADGKTIGVAGIGHDVTVQRQAERLKDELIGIVSHELRGPLTAIRASLKMVEPQVAALDDRVRRMVEIASRNSDRLVALVTDLLDLDRIESGSMPMERAVTNVERIVKEACEEMSPIAEEACVALVVSSETANVNVDAGRVTQALTNLVRNAISFSPKGESVEVSARRMGDVVEIAVRDHGRGIPAEQLGRIFERFKQVEASDSKSRTGSGLGLAISRAVIEQMGGSVAVESKVGSGSTFRITLPVV
jgi:PAS domain S-box-containing protein